MSHFCSCNRPKCVQYREWARIGREVEPEISRLRAEVERLTKERDNFRAVLEGAEFQNLDMIAAEVRDCRQIGIEAAKRIKALAPDATLGRMVRAMPKQSYLRHSLYQPGEWLLIRDVAREHEDDPGLERVGTGDTPEEALAAAGVKP